MPGKPCQQLESHGSTALSETQDISFDIVKRHLKVNNGSTVKNDFLTKPSNVQEIFETQLLAVTGVTLLNSTL